MRKASIVLGITATLTLLGAARLLPPYLAFFISSLSIILFPGIVVAGLIVGPSLVRDSIPERLAVWFVAGTGVVSIAALVALVGHLNLRMLGAILVSVYATVTGLILARRWPAQGMIRTISAGHPRSGPCPGVLVAVFVIAIGMGLVTLITPRDYDDWFYLAYMKDYTAGERLGTEDAIFGEGSAPARARLGGAWWVTLLFRVTWVLPWGMAIALFLHTMGVRRLAAWLILAGIALGLARGNPQNYVKSLAAMRTSNRPSAEAVDMFEFLSAEPSPQGAILAREATGRMIAAFLPKAYPLNFREYGPVDQQTLEDLAFRRHIDEEFLAQIRRYGIRYILIENRTPLAEALAEAGTGFALKHENATYDLWKVDAGTD